MRKDDLTAMSIDELFISMEHAAIRANEEFNSAEPIERQREWMEVHNAAVRELKTRGNEALRRFVALLESPYPSVRLTAALVTRKSDASLAIPVLEDLQHGKYGLMIAMEAQMTIDAMRKRGELPQTSGD